VDILYLAGGVLVHLRCRDAIDHLQRIASASEADEFRRSTASTLLRLFDV
jgi:hypothetical protein